MHRHGCQGVWTQTQTTGCSPHPIVSPVLPLAVFPQMSHSGLGKAVAEVQLQLGAKTEGELPPALGVLEFKTRLFPHPMLTWGEVDTLSWIQINMAFMLDLPRLNLSSVLLLKLPVFKGVVLILRLLFYH